MLVIDKEDVQDSGIEASGETDPSSERGTSPETIQSVTQLKSNNRSHGESHDSIPETQLKSNNRSHGESHDSIPETQTSESEPVKCWNGTRTEHPDSTSDVIHQNGLAEVIEMVKEEEINDEKDEEKEDRRRWSFPPVLDEFDLMETDKDPYELEDIFSDERLLEVTYRLQDDGPGLGISIVGGSGSPNGDLPILVKRVIPGSLAEQEGSIKPGDELIAVNEMLLAGVSKDYAVQAFSKLEGDVRLLVLQDD